MRPKPVRSDEYMFFVDLMLHVMRRLQDGATSTRFVNDRFDVEFEVTVKRIGGAKLPVVRTTPGERT